MYSVTRIGFVVPKLDYGGPEVWLKTLLKYLPRHVQPQAVVTAPGGWVSAEMAAKVTPYAQLVRWDENLSKCLYYLNECDVIITWGSPFYDFRRRKTPSGSPDRKVVFVAHGLAPMDGIRGKEKYATHFAAVCRPAVAFFDDSNQHKVTVIENGVDMEQVTPRMSKDQARALYGIGLDKPVTVIGWAGRLSPEKNPYLFAKVADPLVHRGDFRFLMAGTGDRKIVSEVTNILASYRVPETRYVGVVERIGDFLQAIDALAITSYTEACPLILLEAFAAGVPVITTRYPFIDQLENECGQLTYRIDREAPEESFVGALYELQDDKKAAGMRTLRAKNLGWHRFNASLCAYRWAEYLSNVQRDDVRF